ncbi:hypothetical protein L1S45_01840 [Aeromonas dhakensis]|uniref:hypothetical protein n=1 Tax=Aeromonas dhakensis TaxID=196024 RepID=UPI00208E4361|nr:hypothetical protein [Aeromonas dhakensis]USP10391.1 hypothetical protein L1S45_01840 [Aeromonas dhakensis]
MSKLNQQVKKTWLETNTKLLVFFSTAMVAIFSFCYGDQVAGKTQKEIVGFLVTVSSIIFGVMGAWLSITKVELQNGIDTATTNEVANIYMARARAMIEPITLSSLVIITSIIFMFSYPIISALCIALSFSFSLVSIMTSILIYCLVVIIFYGASFLLDLSTKNQEKRAGRMSGE